MTRVGTTARVSPVWTERATLGIIGADVFAERLTYDRWTGNRDRPTTVERPSWPAIQESIARLDGQEHTIAILSGKDEAHLAIGGGGGRYVVYATVDNQSFHNLVDPGRGAEEERLVAGGQEGAYPARQVISLEEALEAAREYAATGALSKALHWEEA
jgi:hypothetical protein